MPKILALDLSLRASGICKPDLSLETFQPETEGDERLDEIAAHVRDLALGVDLVIMEDLLFMTHKAGQLGMVHGAVRLQLMRKDIRYVVVPSKSMKKYATSHGNAKKEVVIAHWNKRSGQMVTDNNQADAAWLMAMAKDYYREPLFAVPAAQRDALQAVPWPELANVRKSVCRECKRTDKDLPPGAVWVAEDLCSVCDVPPPKVGQTPLGIAQAEGHEDHPDETIDDSGRKSA